jgi:hypothetical protein
LRRSFEENGFSISTIKPPSTTHSKQPPAMRFLALQRPLLAAATGLTRAGFNGVVAPFAAQPATASSLVQGWRFASVKAQGAYKKRNTKGIPKKLGAKRTGGAWPIGQDDDGDGIAMLIGRQTST